MRGEANARDNAEGLGCWSVGGGAVVRGGGGWWDVLVGGGEQKD